MSADFLYGAGEWLIGLLFLAFMLAAHELGFHLGRKAEPRTNEKTKSQISVVQGAILGVLGLLLGFTTAMAVSRFDARRQLVLEEANAIGTSYLRTQLLTSPESTEIASLLRQYVDVRLQYSGAGADLEHLKAAKDRAGRLQNEFWSRGVVFAQKDPRSVTAGLLLQSLNQVIDLEAARWTAFVHHVPETVIYVDGVVALLAAILVGYGYGLGRQRHLFSMFILALSITAVLAVIVDLDRPRQGFIQVSQQPMIHLQHQLAAKALAP